MFPTSAISNALAAITKKRNGAPQGLLNLLNNNDDSASSVAPMSPRAPIGQYPARTASANIGPMLDVIKMRGGNGAQNNVGNFITPAFNPNERHPLASMGAPDGRVNTQPRTSASDKLDAFKALSANRGLVKYEQDAPPATRPRIAEAAPITAEDGRVNAQPNEPQRRALTPDFAAKLEAMNFSVDPNREVTTARRKDQARADAPFAPTDYSLRPLDREQRQFFHERTLGKEPRSGWQKFGDALKIGAAEMNKLGPNATAAERLGALAGGAGGAAFIGEEGRSNALFDAYKRPQRAQQMNDEQVEFKRQYERQHLGNGLALDDAKIETEYGRADNLGSQIGARDEDTKRKNALNAAKVELEKARTEAAKRGTPQQRDIDDGKGQMLRLQVFPNGDIQVLGKSPVPLIEGQRAASRERIAAGRNVTSRANNNTNNANRRQIAAQKLGSTGAGARKAFPAADVSALAQKWGVDEAEAKRRLEVSGYEVR